MEGILGSLRECQDFHHSPILPQLSRYAFLCLAAICSVCRRTSWPAGPRMPSVLGAGPAFLFSPSNDSPAPPPPHPAQPEAHRGGAAGGQDFDPIQ